MDAKAGVAIFSLDQPLHDAAGLQRARIGLERMGPAITVLQDDLLLGFQHGAVLLEGFPDLLKEQGVGLRSPSAWVRTDAQK